MSLDFLTFVSPLTKRERLKKCPWSHLHHLPLINGESKRAHVIAVIGCEDDVGVVEQVLRGQASQYL